MNRTPIYKFVMKDKRGKVTIESENEDWIEHIRKLVPIEKEDRVTKGGKK